jgi:hypothetical protein
MNDYRKAWAVELYDAKTVVSLNKEDRHGFSESIRQGYYVFGDEIGYLMEHLGVDVCWQRQRRSLEPSDLGGIELMLRERWKTHLEDSDTDIVGLAARVDAPGMLSLRITYQNKGGEPDTTEFTYCGRFSVMWDTGDES